jgi:hypothetical protein
MVVEPMRAAIVPLSFERDDTPSVLHATAAQYYGCQNETSDYCWPDTPKQPADLETRKTHVRDTIYARLKNGTSLNANLVQAAIKQTVENVDGCKTDWEKGRRISQPEYDLYDEEGWTMLFDKRSATFRPFEITLSLNDGDQHTARFTLPDELEGTPYAEYVLSDLFEYRVTRIAYRPNSPTRHTFFAHIVSKATIPAAPLPSPEQLTNTAFGELIRTSWRDTIRSPTSGSDTQSSITVLGVDRNVTGYSAVTSAGGFHGRADHLNHRRDQYEHTRASLQQTGTRSAHLTMQSLRKREWRWFDQLAHDVANSICIDVFRVQATHVVFERLTDIRRRISNAKQFQQWFFKRVEKYVEYKLEPYDVVVDDVSGRYTSQACSRMDCDHVARSNRDGKQFECGECGYELDADLNAAKNIAYRYIREEWYGDSLDHDAGEKWFDCIEQSTDGVSQTHMSSGRRAANPSNGDGEDADSQPAPETTSARATARIVLTSGLLSLNGRFARREWPNAMATESPTSPTLNSRATASE